MVHFHHKGKNKLDQFAYKVYKLFYLKDFCVKNAFERSTSWVYNIVFMVISLIGLIPIIESFVNSVTLSNFVYEHFYFSIFILSFFYLFDILIRIICAKYYYSAETYLKGLKSLSLSFFCYVEFATWATTIIIILSLGKFEGAKVVLENTDYQNAIRVTTTVMFLMNTFTGYKRFFLYSHNMSDLEMFADLIKEKRKFWVTSIVIVVFVILIISFAIYTFEVHNTPPPGTTTLPIKTMWDALYFSLVTVTTVGFGVMMPTTLQSKIFVVILMITGIYMYAFLSSQFINVFNEFFAKKKEMSEEAATAKEKEVEQEYILQRIDLMLVENMYKAKIIDKKTYNKLLKEKQKQQDLVINNRYKETDFSFDKESKTIYFCGNPLGNYITDPEASLKAFEKNWGVVSKQDAKLAKPKAALYFLTTRVATDLAHNKDKIQIIFTSKQIDKHLQKLIIYQKKPYVSTICEFDIAATLEKDKELMWEKFGEFTNLSKEKFNSIFKNQKNVTAIFAKNIVLYPKPKQIETYGISNTNNMKEIIPVL